MKPWRIHCRFTLIGMVIGIMIILLLAASCASGPSVEVYQQRTVAACGFKPSADTVRKILAVKNEVLLDPDTMALAICSSVRSLGSERKSDASQKFSGLDDRSGICLRLRAPEGERGAC